MDAKVLFDLKGKVALVVGGSRGIGFAIAEGLASMGAKVVIANSTAEQGERAAAQLRSQGREARAIAVDLRRDPSINALVTSTVQAFGQIDVLVNSAAVIRRGPIEDVSEDDWDTMMGINLRGAFLLCQAVGRHMIERQAGKIVNVSSNVSQVLQPHRGAYAITKAGLSHLTRVLALEWAPHHINVNAIAPAPTITDLNRKFFEDNPADFRARMQSIPMGRLGAPADYVGAAIFLASQASDFVTGQTFFVDGGSNLI
ncbi:MAG TPA: glucose 1-dehydrogenase [Candidatus Baltobacteraceae bacterium]|nr:glucose 1-dehydrogenase [Candidatus Baltobacteraceae bacterium]